MCIPWGKIFSSIPRSKSSVQVKVKYQGHIFKKKRKKKKQLMVSDRALIFHKCIPFW